VKKSVLYSIWINHRQQVFANTCTYAIAGAFIFFGFHSVFAFIKREAKAGVRKWDVVPLAIPFPASSLIATINLHRLYSRRNGSHRFLSFC
jgi:hypothetical protein